MNDNVKTEQQNDVTTPEGDAPEPVEPLADAPVPEDAEEPADDAQEPAQEPEEDAEPEETPDPESFPREYVEKLRREAADARVKARAADALAHRLHAALVSADGRLVAPEELPYDAAHLEDADALAAAVDELLARKPYLAARRVRGDVGQGTAAGSSGVDLAGMLRARA